MKKVVLIRGIVSLAAAANLFIALDFGLRASLASEIEWRGELEIKGSLNLSTGGKAVVFPDATRQQSAPPTYFRTIIVSPVGNSLQNGAELLEKRASITDASSARPYLLKIEPGVYDIGAESLVMGQYIDIEGAGPRATVITGGGEGMVGTVIGASNAEIRDLSVINIGQGDWSRAIYNSHALRMTNIEAGAGGASSNAAIVNASGSAPVISNVLATAEGGTSAYGIYSYSCSAGLYYVKAYATNATAQNCGIHNEEMTSLVIENSKARGQSGGTAIGVYIHKTAKASLFKVTAEASGEYGYGIKSNDSAVSIREVLASASGGTYSYGIQQSGDNLLLNVVASASSSEHCAGIENSGGSPLMMNVIATASGGTISNYGLHNPYGSGTVVLDRCTFKGATRSISAMTGLVLKVGGSRLEGDVDTEGAWTCVHCYDANGAALNASCRH